MKEIGTDAVAAGLYELLKERPELMEGETALEADQEPAAAALLLAATRGNWADWVAVDPRTARTARGLLLHFFAKVGAPRAGEFLGVRWRVQADSPVAQALEVVAIEMRSRYSKQEALL